MSRIPAANPRSRWGNVCVYPRVDNQGDYHLVKEWARELNAESASGVYLIKGDPGCGKTFHLVLLGLQWEARRQLLFTVARPKCDRLAFYGNIRDIGIDDLREQWTLNRTSECLWLLDDIRPTDQELFCEIAEAFIQDHVSESSHRLVGAAWNVPKALPKSVKVIDFRVNTELLGYAFEAKALPFTESQIASIIECSGDTGLRVLLWYAEMRRKEAATAEFRSGQIWDIWAKMEVDQQKDLSEAAKHLFGMLAVLQILGVGLPDTIDPAWIRSLQTLESSGLIRRESGVCKVDDDEKAIAWVKNRFRRDHSSPLPQFFVGQLLPLLIDDLSDASASFCLEVLLALRSMSVVELRALLSDGSQLDETGSLLQVALKTDSIWSSLVNAIESLSLEQASNILMLLSQQGFPVRDAVARMLSNQRARLYQQAEHGSVLAFTSVLLAARAAQDYSLIQDFAGLVDNERLLRAVDVDDGAPRGKFETVRTFRAAFGEGIGNEFIRRWLAKWLSDITPKQFWRRARRVAASDLAHILPLVSEKRLSEACVMEPSDALSCFAHLPDSGRGKTMWTLFKHAVRLADPVVAKDWPHPYCLFGWIRLLAQLGEKRLADNPIILEAANRALESSNGAVIRTLSDVANRRFKGTTFRYTVVLGLRRTLDRKRVPINERLFGLAELDPKSAVKTADAIFATMQPSLHDPLNLFWLMMNGMVALWSLRSESLIEFTKKVYLGWNDVLSVPDAYSQILSLAGLCSFITSQPPPIFRLPEWPPTFLPESPPATVCQFYALCRSEHFDWTTWLGQYLTGSSESEHLRSSIASLRRCSAPWIPALQRILEQAAVGNNPEITALSRLLSRSNVFHY